MSHRSERADSHNATPSERKQRKVSRKNSHRKDKLNNLS